MSRKLTAALLAFLLLPLGLAQAQTITRSFEADSGGMLSLELTAGGQVTITGGSQDVQIEVVREGRDADEVEVEFSQSGDEVFVESDYRSNGRHNVEVHYDIRVPAQFNISLELTGGAVNISGVSGLIEGQTMGGALVLESLSGEIDLQTMGGAISLTNSDLDGKVHTMGGAITLEDVSGDVNATTMGGNVTYRNVRPRGNAEMRVKTMGGDIRVEDAPAGADVHTMGGDIEVGDVTGFLRAETMGGDIDAESVNGWIEAKTMGGDVSIRMVGASGDRHVEITSMGGDINLVVPDGMPMDIDVTITVDDRGGRTDYVIESDFDLKVEAPSSMNRGRTRITGQGVVLGGGNPVRIRTTNGNVRILKGN